MEPFAAETDVSVETEPNADRARGLGSEARAQLDEADAALRTADMPAIARAIARLTDAAPNHPEVLRVRAVLLHMQGRHVEAARLLRRALRQWPDDELAWNNLGSALGQGGDTEASIAAFRRAAELAPQQVTTWFNLGHAYDLQAMSAEAHSALNRALACDPDHLPSLITRARVMQTMGLIGDAHQDYRHALRVSPDSARAWFGLSVLAAATFDASDVAAMEDLHARSDLADDERIRLGFALAKGLADQERYAEAFAVLREANTAKRNTLRWDAAAFSRYVDGIEAAFAQPTAQASDQSLGSEVVFVTGMPRSGSTLVEQILAAHADVEGANELTVLPNLIAEESRRRGVEYPAWIGHASAEDWRRLGQAYLERTARWRQRHPRFTDKGLATWRYIGAAAAMLPGARFVVCRRDPVETCFSCFRQLFAADQAFTYDLAELAAHWRDHDRLVRMWQRRDPDRVRTVVHENLLAEPDAEIRALLDFCRLPFDAACLHSHETDRTVRTVSATQVRRPLRKDTAQAHLYGAALDPLRQALADGLHAATTT